MKRNNKKSEFRYFILITFFISCFNYSFSNDLHNSTKNAFVLEYSANVPDSIKSCIQNATKVWSKYIFSNQPIKMKVLWSDLSGNVRGYCIANELFIGLEGLPIQDALYPVALAEKILNRNLNSDEPDILCVLDKDANWNIKDRQPEADELDLLTVVIHEITHGLGYTGNLTMKDGKMTLLELPLVFDKYIMYADTLSVLDAFLNEKVEQDSLLAISTSDKLSWGGKIANAVFDDEIKLYAPSKFNSGSTFYHLDEHAFPLGDTNTLMTPAFSVQERVLSPGVLNVAMLADIGWDDFFIQDELLGNTENLLENKYSKVNFNTAHIDTSWVQLLYSYDNGINYDTITLNYNVDSLCFLQLFPAYPFERSVKYAYRTKSVLGNTIFLPSQFPKDNYSFFVGKDVEPPKIEHESVSYVSIENDSLVLRMNITDNFNVDSSYVKVFYCRDDKVFKISTIKVQQDLYGEFAEIPLLGIGLQEGDQIAYNIFSVDKNKNFASLLLEGEYQFITVEPVKTPVDFYATNFDNDVSDDFYLDGFTVHKEEGFSSNALHTAHPYKSSGIDGNYIQYIAELKTPIRLGKNRAEMKFDEVVLVEPRDLGVVYGEFGFWDYVVVEATKDKSSGDWYPLGKVGYDSQENDEWLDRYYSDITSANNNSSLALGTEKLYLNRTINLLENKYFRTGDTVSIRFRLQSDNNANAWGWAIDNLEIQKNEVSITNTLGRECDMRIMPNPAKDFVYINTKQQILSVKLYDILGKRISVNLNDNYKIDVSNLQKGMYMLFVQTNESTHSFKVVKD